VVGSGAIGELAPAEPEVREDLEEAEPEEEAGAPEGAIDPIHPIGSGRNRELIPYTCENSSFVVLNKGRANAFDKHTT
jgi:hypothetical protein